MPFYQPQYISLMLFDPHSWQHGINLSSFKIFSIESHSSGSKYILSATTGSVIIVAGLEFIKVPRYLPLLKT